MSAAHVLLASRALASSSPIGDDVLQVLFYTTDLYLYHFECFCKAISQFHLQQLLVSDQRLLPSNRSLSVASKNIPDFALPKQQGHETLSDRHVEA